MMQDNSINWAIFKLEPDFNVLRRYISLGSNEKEVKKYIKDYKRNGSIVELHFMSLEEEDRFAEGIVKIINKYPLQGHGVNLTYLTLVLLKSTYIQLTEYTLPAINGFEPVARFEEFVNYLLKNATKGLEIMFRTVTDTKQQRGKRNVKKVKEQNAEEDALRLTDSAIAKWIVDTLLNSVMQYQYPLSLGYQLYNSAMVCNVKSKKEFLKLDENAFFVTDKIATVQTDAITDICLPILNYLQGQTDIKKEKANDWSFSQLSVLIDLLILIKYYVSTNKQYKLGSSNPTTADKKYLDNLLRNKLNQGKVVRVSALQV